MGIPGRQRQWSRQPGLQRSVDPIRLVGLEPGPAASTDFLLRANIPNSSTSSRCGSRRAIWRSTCRRTATAWWPCAARDLQQQINTMIELLGHPEVGLAYGAGDMWQVIDQVAALELAGAEQRALPDARNVRRDHHQVAVEEDNIKRFNSATSGDKVIDVDEVSPPIRTPAGVDATEDTRRTTTWSTPASSGWPIPPCRTIASRNSRSRRNRRS
jgi:hypothetical protein